MSFIAPIDGSNTLYSTQQIIVRAEDFNVENVGETAYPLRVAGDTVGSGVNPSSFSITIRHLTGLEADRTPSASWSAPYMTSAVLTLALTAGHSYRATVSASDNDGNQTTITSDFKVLSAATASTPTVSITEVAPDSYAAECGGLRFTWNNVVANVGSSDIAINATSHVGQGTLNVTLPASSIQVTYSIETPGLAPVEQTNIYGDVPFTVSQTGSITQTVAATTASVGTLTACLPSTAIPSTVRLQLPQMNAQSIGFRLCSNPLTSTLCSADPIKSFGHQENLWGPWRNLKNNTYKQIPGAVATNLGYTLASVPAGCDSYAGTLAQAVADLGTALGTTDSLNEGVSFTTPVQNWLKWLIKCTAVHIAALVQLGVPGSGGPTDAHKKEWLATERDITAILDARPDFSQEANEANCKVDSLNAICVDRDLTNHDTTYTTPYLIQIDPIGDDRYNNAPAAADLVRWQSSAIGWPLRVLLDVAGHDKYGEVDNFSALSTTGAGTGFGVGILLDAFGNDFYYATNESGIGFGGSGAGYLIDTGGNDQYTNTWNNTQGRSIGSSLLGLGFVYDSYPLVENDVDQYKADHAQFDIGTAYGGVGLVIDASTAGNNTYNSVTDNGAAGGQAIGVVGLAGIGAVIDAGGNDTYTCTQSNSVCLGSSLTSGSSPGGLALLYDFEGFNTFTVALSAPTATVARAAIGATTTPLPPDLAAPAFVVLEGVLFGRQTHSCKATLCWGVWLGTFLDLANDDPNYGNQAPPPYKPLLPDQSSRRDQYGWFGARNGDFIIPSGMGVDLL